MDPDQVWKVGWAGWAVPWLPPISALRLSPGPSTQVLSKYAGGTQ